MLSRFFLTVCLMLTMFSCSSAEPKVEKGATQKQSLDSRIVANLAWFFSSFVDRDTFYEYFNRTTKSLDDSYINPHFDFRVFDEQDTRVEYFKRKNRENKRLLIVGNGGTFLNIYDLTRRKFYVDKITEPLEDYDVMIVDLHMGYQHRFPVQTQDFLAAFRLALKLGYNPSNVAFIGDSSGGNIVMSSSVYLSNKGLPMPGKIVLMSPFLDATNEVESRKRNSGIDALFGDFGRSSLRLKENLPYFGAVNDLSNKYISPVYENNFKNFPSTLIQVSDSEILTDDSVVIHRKLVDNGVNATLELYRGQLHVFQITGVTEAKLAIDHIHNFLEKKENVKDVKYSRDVINKIRFDEEVISLPEQKVYEKFKKVGIDLEALIKREKQSYIKNKRGYLNREYR